jgi:CheY-like chemotaxis protein
VPGTRVGEARLAGALARLLRRESRLLAREEHDAASRAAALRGLEWAADFVRALEAEPCAAWLDALRERGAERPGHAPEAWRALGAPTCLELSELLDREKTLAPLLPEARGWRGMATAVRAHVEPAETAAPVAPPPSAESPAATRVAGDPTLLRALFSALAEWSGPYGARTVARGGRIEISGARPSEHPEPGRIAEGVLESMRRLHLAAARVAAPLIVDDPSEGAVRWTVRLPAADEPRHLFAEAGGRRIALPWHAVVAYGLGEGGRPHVVLGRGLERIAVGLDWLHGLGPGRRVEGGAGAAEAEAVGAVLFESPALTILPGGLVSDEGERYAEAGVRPLELRPPPPPPPPPPAPAEALQRELPPADTIRDAVSPRRALVADDSFTARVFLRRLLAMRGIEVDEAEQGNEARARLSATRYDLVFLDADMPGGGALALASGIDAADRGRIVALVRDEAERAAAQAAGFAQTLFKPFAEDEVAAALAALAEDSRPGA